MPYGYPGANQYGNLGHSPHGYPGGCVYPPVQVVPVAVDSRLILKMIFILI